MSAEAPAADPTGSASASASSGDSSATTTIGTSGSAAEAACGGFRRSASADDALGDAGPTAPATGDLVGIRVDDGGDRGRFVVTMGAPLPPALGEGETIGVGVELTGGGTSDGHQLFVQGDESGWLAYLYAPGGFVEYPGDFAIAGPQLVLTVPWSALGKDTQSASVFSDWSRPVVAVNQGGSDAIAAVHPLKSC